MRISLSLKNAKQSLSAIHKEKKNTTMFWHFQSFPSIFYWIYSNVTQSHKSFWLSGLSLWQAYSRSKHCGCCLLWPLTHQRRRAGSCGFTFRTSSAPGLGPWPHSLELGDLLGYLLIAKSGSLSALPVLNDTSIESAGQRLKTMSFPSVQTEGFTLMCSSNLTPLVLWGCSIPCPKTQRWTCRF